MTTTMAIEMIRRAVQLGLMVSAPMLITALVVGLLVSLIQAVTQLQEQTLTFIPKLVLLAVVFALALPWVLGQLVGYLATVLRTLPVLG